MMRPYTSGNQWGNAVKLIEEQPGYSVPYWHQQQIHFPNPDKMQQTAVVHGTIRGGI